MCRAKNYVQGKTTVFFFRTKTNVNLMFVFLLYFQKYFVSSSFSFLQLSPPSNELALQTNFRYDSRKCFLNLTQSQKKGNDS